MNLFVHYGSRGEAITFFLILVFLFIALLVKSEKKIKGALKQGLPVQG